MSAPAGLFWTAAAIVALSLSGAVLAPVWREGAARSRRVAASGAAMMALGAMMLYGIVGDPASLRTLPADVLARLNDPARATAPSEAAELAARLDEHLARAPSDRRARLILARVRFAQAQFALSVAAFQHLLDDGSPLAGDAGLWCEYADALGMVQGGRLAGPPMQALERALRIDPVNPKALDMAASAALETGDAARALEHWGRLLRLLPVGSERQRELRVAIERLEMRTGLMREAGR